MSRLARAALAGWALTACSCTPVPYDYTAYRARMPRSILVLPPLNESTEVDASYSYLSTVSRPLGESGYYVFPVAVVDAFMKENGLPTSGEMHEVPPSKLREVFGADAILYVTVQDWGQKYLILTSKTIVKARVALVDAATGTTLWEGVAHLEHASGDAGGGLIGAAINAVVTQILSAATDPAHDLSSRANHLMVFNQHRGLLRGRYHPGFEVDLRGR